MYTKMFMRNIFAISILCFCETVHFMLGKKKYLKNTYPLDNNTRQYNLQSRQRQTTCIYRNIYQLCKVLVSLTLVGNSIPV